VSHPTLDSLLNPGPDEVSHLSECPQCRVDLRLAQTLDTDPAGLAEAREAMSRTSRVASLTFSQIGPGVGLQTGARLHEGEEVDGRWIVEATIGRGGVGTVYRIRHKLLGSHHALKVLHLHSSELRGRLMREGRTQATMGHPNVVQVTDIIELEGVPALVMEFVDGGSLRQLQQMIAPFDLHVCHGLACHILDGVAAAHAARVIHRDLKPENVLVEVRPDGLRARVTDFGLAKTVNTTQGSVVTRKGAMLGTPAYMAPEQLMSASDVDERADVFALGALLYELYTSRRALLGFSSLDLRMGVPGAVVRPPSTLRSDLPIELERAIMGALEPRREQRIQLPLLAQAFARFRPPFVRLSELDARLWQARMALQD